MQQQLCNTVTTESQRRLPSCNGKTKTGPLFHAEHFIYILSFVTWDFHLQQRAQIPVGV